MKWSKYNFLFQFKKSAFFLYNSRCGLYVKLDEGFYNNLKQLERNEFALSDLSQTELDYFKKNKVLVDDLEDENVILQMKYLKARRSFDRTTLALVIAPTLACNFMCPYCYESNLPSTIMSEETQDNVVNFINQYKGQVENLNICWHGGEPLIAYDTIKLLVRKIKERVEIPITKHLMVSNGYLFTNEMCHFFNETHLNYVQITIDGTEETHNKNRKHKLGLPTYKKILENIDMITSEMPDCRVGIRVNIHNDNKEEYPVVYKELTERWKGKKCSVYPAFVLDQGNCNVSCLSTVDKSLFYINLWQEHGVENINFRPDFQIGSCSAIYDNQFIIDSSGLMYKCWADVGLKERSIGDVVKGVTNYKFVSEYMFGSDKFTDSKCLDCKMFPICDGGCNRYRVEHKYKGTPYNVCPIDEKSLKKKLEIVFEQTRK